MTFFPKKLSKQNVFFLFENPKMVSKKKCFLQNNTFTTFERCFYHDEKCFVIFFSKIRKNYFQMNKILSKIIFLPR